MICSRIALMAGDRRNVKPTAATRSDFSARSTMACPSATDGASGFSHSTCLPASSRPVAISRCSAFPTTTLTASLSGASALACLLVSARS